MKSNLHITLCRGTVTLCYIQVYDFQLTQRNTMYFATIIMVRIPLCCMPKWHAHPTRRVEEFRNGLIRVPSIFVLNQQVSVLIITTVSTPKVNELSIKDKFLLHNFVLTSINMLEHFHTLF